MIDSVGEEDSGDVIMSRGYYANSAVLQRGGYIVRRTVSRRILLVGELPDSLCPRHFQHQKPAGAIVSNNRMMASPKIFPAIVRWNGIRAPVLLSLIKNAKPLFHTPISDS